MKIKLRDGERLDDLNLKGYQIIQNKDTFCFGMDAVLLSDFAKVKKGEQVLDIGTGTGIIPILLKAKTEGKHFVGLDIQKESVELAKRSVALNNLTEEITMIQGDIKEADQLFTGASFDVITTNPPYMTGNHGLVNPKEQIAIARHEILCTLEDVIKQSSRLLKANGRFYMVHRPFRLAEIFVLMNRYNLEPKRMRLVYPFSDKEPNMVLIEGLHGGKSRITVESPLIVYESQGKYTKEIMDIYGMEYQET
ncbi:MAG TPA: tRNA1(Val) (adenine(37)-N6)-methyltransferase [Candidatus Merdenecus merdavium]|nr:tRNA1(Val) (adenine(37)-N6)-methyltransferase [Candidatus Merdenecus merdavium]